MRFTPLNKLMISTLIFLLMGNVQSEAIPNDQEFNKYLQVITQDLVCPEGTEPKLEEGRVWRESCCVSKESGKKVGISRLNPKGKDNLTIIRRYSDKLTGVNSSSMEAEVNYDEDGELMNVKLLPSGKYNPTTENVIIDEETISNRIKEKPLPEESGRNNHNVSFSRNEGDFSGCTKEINSYIVCPEGSYKYQGPSLGTEIIDSVIKGGKDTEVAPRPRKPASSDRSIIEI